MARALWRSPAGLGRIGSSEPSRGVAGDPGRELPGAGGFSRRHDRGASVTLRLEDKSHVPTPSVCFFGGAAGGVPSALPESPSRHTAAKGFAAAAFGGDATRLGPLESGATVRPPSAGAGEHRDAALL